MAPPSRSAALALYRSLLRAAASMPTHNRRALVRARARSAFEAAASQRDPLTLAELFLLGETQLENARIQASHLTVLADMDMSRIKGVSNSVANGSHLPQLSPHHLGALRWALGRLASVGAEHLYQITGGLAGAIHGSSHGIEDIDIDVDNEALERLAASVERAGPAESGVVTVWHPLGPYADREFRFQLFACYEVEGAEVEMTGAKGCFLRRPSPGGHRLLEEEGSSPTDGEGEELEEVPFDVDVASEAIHVVHLPGLELPVRVQPLDELLRYKVLSLGFERSVDSFDPTASELVPCPYVASPTVLEARATLSDRRRRRSRGPTAQANFSDYLGPSTLPHVTAKSEPDPESFVSCR